MDLDRTGGERMESELLMGFEKIRKAHTSEKVFQTNHEQREFFGELCISVGNFCGKLEPD